MSVPQDYDNSERENRYSILKFDYNSNLGTLKNIDCRNKHGQVIARWKISSKDGVKATLIDFIGVTDLEASSYLNSITILYVSFCIAIMRPLQKVGLLGLRLMIRIK